MPQNKRNAVAPQQVERGSVRVLRWLEQYPFQRARDLVIALAPFEGRSSVYTRLADLKARHLIEAVRPAGGGEWLYHLSPPGRAACARWAGNPGAVLSLQDEREKLIRWLPRLPVLLVVQDLVNGLVSGAAAALTRRGRHADVIQWNWQRDSLQHFRPLGKGAEEVTMRVDGTLALHLRFSNESTHWEEWHSLLVLYCPLSEIRLLRQRLDRIVRWRESAERWLVYSQMPTVVILATTPRQAEWWHLAALQVTRRLHVEMLHGAVACLPTGEFGNSWRLAWRTLGTAISSHLQDLVQPATAPAFPELARFSQARVHEAASEEDRHPRGKRAYHLADVSRQEYRLNSLRLVPRQWDTLRLCFEHPLLSSDNLAAFLGIDAKFVRALLRELQHLDYLVPIETAVGQRWQLAEPGLRLLARLTSCHVSRFVHLPVVAHEPLQQRGVKGLLHQASHVAGLYGFFATLATELMRVPGAHLRWWETGAICERVFAWRGKIYHFKPDAFAGVRIGGRTLRFWLEWDRGTMGVRDLESKCATYAAFLTSRDWMGGSSLPPVLLGVFPDLAQEQRFRKTACALLAHVSGFQLYTTTASLIITQNLLHLIWRPVLGTLAQRASPESGRRVALFAPEEDANG